MQKVRDIYGNTIVVTDLAAAIRQCEDCQDSPFIVEKGARSVHAINICCGS